MAYVEIETGGTRNGWGYLIHRYDGGLGYLGHGEVMDGYESEQDARRAAMERLDGEWGAGMWQHV